MSPGDEGSSCQASAKDRRAPVNRTKDERIRRVAMRFSHFFHSLFSWVLATLLVGICVAVFYFFHRGEEELRRYLEQHINAKFPHLRVQIGSAHLIRGEGIRLRDLSLVKKSRGAEMPRSEMAFCDEVLLACNPSVSELMEGKVEVQRVLLRGLHLQPTRYANGTWNLAELIPTQRPQQPLPTVQIEDARLEVLNQASIRPTRLVFQDVKASFTPSIETPGNLEIQGSFDSRHFQNAELSLSVHLPSRSWSGSGSVVNLHCDEDLWAALNSQAIAVPPLLDGLRAVAQVQFSLAQGGGESTPRFHVNAKIDNGKYEAPRFLAHPITDISIPSIRCTYDRGWVVKNASANYGMSRLQVATAAGPSFVPGTDLQADVSVQDLNITREMIGILPTKFQELWSKYQPLGIMDVKAICRRTQGKWLSSANATCKDISLRCARFRYPLTRCYGKVQFEQEQRLNVDLWAAPDRTWAQNPIHIVADVRHPGPHYTGQVHVSMLPDTWLPIDARVREAMSPKIRQVLDDMSAHGELTFRSTLSRTSPTAPLSKESVILVRRGDIKHQRFPYPVQNISGQIHVKDATVRFSQFVGHNDSCVVTCEGFWDADPTTHRSNLAVDFVARDIPCDTELRAALPSGPQRVWRELRPAGTIDHALIKLTHQSDMAKPEYDITVTQQSKGRDPDRRSLELQPSWFPLSMDRVTGKFRFLPSGKFHLNDFQAEHGLYQRTVKLRTNGHGEFREDGSWEVSLDRVIADRIQTTPEFLAALPRAMGESLRDLKFQGTLFVNADRVHFLATDPHLPVQAFWSATINVDNGQLELAQQPVTSLFGEIHAQGRSQADGWVHAGEAHFDTASYNGYHITNLETPWYLDGQRFVYGDSVRIEGERPRPATAEVFGGVAQSTGQVAFTENIGYGFKLAVNDFDIGHADLKMPSSMSGKADASLTLQGTAQGNHTLRGQGGIRVREANLAKLPEIIALLNTLRIKKSRTDVFNESSIDFRIDGPTLFFDRFDLHGDSLSLKGRGRMEFDQRVYLKFYSLLGGEKLYAKPLLPWAKQTSENLLQIYVAGTVDKLRVSQEMGPGWKELFPNQPAMAHPRQPETRR